MVTVEASLWSGYNRFETHDAALDVENGEIVSNRQSSDEIRDATEGDGCC